MTGPRVTSGVTVCERRERRTDRRYSAIQQLALEHNVGPLRQDFKYRSDHDEDRAGACVQGSHAWSGGWILNYIWQSRRHEGWMIPARSRPKEASKTGRAGIYSTAAAVSRCCMAKSTKVRINYYPPRGDNKAGWDHHRYFCGSNYRCRSTWHFCAATRFCGAHRLGPGSVYGFGAARWHAWMEVQEGSSFYFKSPMTAPGLYPAHDCSQLMMIELEQYPGAG